jgi:hypothetical protein
MATISGVSEGDTARLIEKLEAAGLDAAAVAAILQVPAKALKTPLNSFKQFVGRLSSEDDAKAQNEERWRDWPGVTG